MEVDAAMMSVGILVAFVILFLTKALSWVWLEPKRAERFLRRQGIKGNSYKLVFGDTKELTMMLHQAHSKPIHIDDDIATRLVPFQNQLVKVSGKNSFFWYGPKITVNIMDPEAIKEILNMINDFPKPNLNPLGKFLITGLVDLEGDKWSKHRKIINPAFNLIKLKLVLPAMYDSCNQMMKEWKMLVCETGSCVVDVWPFLNNLTADVISRTAFGSNYEEGKIVFQLLKEQAKLTSKVFRSIYIPGWRFLPTTLNKRMKKIDNEIGNVLRGIIQKQEGIMKTCEASNDNLLGLLLESNQKEIEDQEGLKKDVGMNTNDVIKECKLFYFAGQETTSVLLNWTMVLLSRFPKWQTLAREEVIEIFGTKEPDYDGLSRLKVVTMILYEVLRLYPPVTAITRILRKKAKVGNMSLPAGALATIPVVLVHHDFELWGSDAKEFKPERFSEGISKATNGKVSFIPFGWGPRICIGQNFALLEAKMALSLILQNFKFELSSSYVHAPIVVITAQPQFGTHLILQKL